LYVCLTHSKLTSLWFFLLLGCYILFFNDLFFFRSSRISYLSSFVPDLRVQK